MTMKLIFCVACICAAAALEVDDNRLKRDVQPWQLDPNVRRDENGNVITDIKVEHHDENHDVHAGWSKVVDGPNRAKPSWNVGGTIRWRREAATKSFDESPNDPSEETRVKRSPEDPWIFNPNVGRVEDGNTMGDLALHHQGDDHDFHATWSKSNRAKPTWNVGGSFRFRRDVQPWQVDPNVRRDENGNVITDVKVQHHGENHDVHAGWSKVVDGPNRAKPSWNVGGTIRWRREAAIASVDESPSELSEEETRVKRSPEDPWIFNPNLGRDEDGNTRGDLKLNHQGDRAKPVWNVGGSFKF